MGGLPRPAVPDGAVRVLSEELHALHHRAGWPSLRTLAREVGCSHTTVSVAFSDPRVPRWGLLELLVEAMSGDVPRFHELWLAASERPTPPQALPPAVAGFTGRRDELAALDRLLDARGAAVPLAVVCGTAGVGKTALAVRWAHRVAERFPDGQLQIDLRGYDPDQPLTSAQALESLLRSLGVDGPALPASREARVARYRTLLASRRMLILLDNAASAGQVRDLLPGTASCAVVVTSRDSLPALVARHGALRLRLELLGEGESVALLRELIGSRVDAAPDDAVALARRCAHLPLALRVAAELAAARPAAPLADLVAQLSLDLLAAGDDPYTAVRSVFSWSCRRLAPAEVLAFRLLGLHPGPSVDAGALAALAGVSRPAAASSLGRLAGAHLVEEIGDGRFRLHDLLRAYAAEQVPQLPDPAGSRARLLDHLASTAAVA